uniref:Uncharacterized protein n=1 Tax=Ditylenchus dipsaci TaxID=166011 RepID=A0A915EW65_9BILA
MYARVKVLEKDEPKQVQLGPGRFFLAQNVGNDKSIKVLCDIIATMFSKSCLELIFEPQELYSKAALRQFFEQIAHSSVMRLNEASMDKLFDLMTMAVKYQVLLCKEPSELVLVTLNHLDGVKAIFKEHGHILECIDHAYTLLMDNFVETPLWEMAAVRSEVLNYLLGSRVKVSLMLREKRQLEDGRCAVLAAVVPGTVRYFNQGEVSHVDEFPVTEQFKMSQEHQHGMAMPMMSRGTTLGHNMYRSHESTHIKGAGGTASRVGTPPAGNEMKVDSKKGREQPEKSAKKGKARGAELLEMMDEAAADSTRARPKSKQSGKPMSRAASAKRKGSTGSSAATKKT